MFFTKLENKFLVRRFQSSTPQIVEKSYEPLIRKLPYPKSVFFIVSNEFCERFSYYGMRTILSIYLTDILLFHETDAKIIYHAFTMLVYFFPIFGAMLADSVLGKFRTIFYVSIVYVIGNVVLALAAIEPLHLPDRGFSMLGLLLIALGSGGIKPCVSAFGGDQFVLPQQELQLAMFFSMFYFSINAGSFISTLLTPVLREKVNCFGETSCFPLAFGVPGILMAVSIVIFVAGKPMYKIREPEGNMVLRVSRCIGYAIKNRSKSPNKQEHWLDYAKEKYGNKLVEDIKRTLKVLVLYLPLPVFWALFDQQGTGWTFQARRMDGYIGFYTILPDQLQVLNPLLILAFIPLFQTVVYPCLAKCNLLKSPLQKIATGICLAAVSFAISACIALVLEASYPKLASEGNGQLRIYNTYPCDVRVTSASLNLSSLEIKQGSFHAEVGVPLEGNSSYAYSISGGCVRSPTTGSFQLYEGFEIGYFFGESGGEFFVDSVAKPENAYPFVRNLINSNGFSGAVNVTYFDKNGNERLFANSTDTSVRTLDPGTYTVKIGDSEEHTVELKLGGVYAFLAAATAANTYNASLTTVTNPNNVHMLWLVPQYVIITAAEIMFSITGLEFSYSQAPSSMKAVLQACWLLTTAFGNLLVIIIEAASKIDLLSTNFFVYAALMFADLFVFGFIAMRYKYVELAADDPDDMSLQQQGEDNPVFKKNNNE